MKNTIKIIAFIGTTLLIIAAVVFAVKSKPEVNQIENSPATFMASAFTWRYIPGEKDLDGLPQTQIFVDASYQNEKIISRKIDEVQGSCNEIDSKAEDADRVAGTMKIQCYAAGLGQWYKIVSDETAYQVRKKEFVEAGPDLAPPDYQYKTVAEFPLAI